MITLSWTPGKGSKAYNIRKGSPPAWARSSRSSGKRDDFIWELKGNPRSSPASAWEMVRPSLSAQRFLRLKKWSVFEHVQKHLTTVSLPGIVKLNMFNFLGGSHG